MARLITVELVFRSAWQHFIEGRAGPSTDYCELSDSIICCYQDPAGNRCPLGLVLPDWVLDRYRFEQPSLLCRLYPGLLDTGEDWNEVIRHLHDRWVLDGRWSVSHDQLTAHYRHFMALRGLEES